MSYFKGFRDRYKLNWSVDLISGFIITESWSDLEQIQGSRATLISGRTGRPDRGFPTLA